MSAAQPIQRVDLTQLMYDIQEVQKDIADCIAILARHPEDKSTIYRKFASEHLLARLQAEQMRRKFLD